MMVAIDHHGPNKAPTMTADHFRPSLMVTGEQFEDATGTPARWSGCMVTQVIG